MHSIKSRCLKFRFTIAHENVTAASSSGTFTTIRRMVVMTHVAWPNATLFRLYGHGICVQVDGLFECIHRHLHRPLHFQPYSLRFSSPERN